MGSVYRAWDGEKQEWIALKVLRLDRVEDPREMGRFRHEAQWAARLRHPNIVAIQDWGQGEGCLYIAMELIRGASLRTLLRQKGKLAQDQALSVAGQVLTALRVAHEHHLIHRDIKPENLLLQEDGTLKVLDFGVAKLEGGTLLTRADEILGTVEYMAPEQVLGDKLSPAVDLYATGVLLYEMLTGALPFTGESPATLVYHQLNEDPRPPSFLNPAVSRSLDRFVLRMLDKLPENRHGSAASALEALEEIRQRHRLAELPGTVLSPEPETPEEELRTRNFQPRFVGRQREFDLLAGHFNALDKGGKVVFLCGEAGVGKSRLVEEVGAYAERNGGRFIHGNCFFEHALGSYMPFLDALGNLFSKTQNGLSDDERRTLARLLARESPELAILAEQSGTTARELRAGFTATFGSEEDSEARRQRLFDTVFNLLATAAASQPLVIALEDMHWADEGSLHLMHYLIRQIGEVPLLCLATYRPEELAADERLFSLGKLLTQFGAENLVQEVRLERLDRDSLFQLARSIFLEADFSEEFGDFLYAHSQGNPFIGVETLKLLRHQQVLYCESGIWSVQADLSSVGVPDRVNSLIMRRLDQLEPELRELLQLGSVIGQRFTSRLLQEVSGMARITLLKALFRLEKQHRLIAAADGSYEFSHAKIREVLYREIPWELQREYHRIIAVILEERRRQGEAVEDAELGHHLYRAEEFARSLSYLERAGDQAYRLFEWRQAAVLYDQVATACRRSKGPVQVLLRALKFGGCSHVHLAVFEKALACFGEMRQAALEAGQAEGAADAWLQAGEAHRLSGHFAEAGQAYEKALECLGEKGSSLLRGQILVNQGIIAFECGCYEEAQSRWREAQALFQGAAPQKTADALNNLAVLATVRGDLEGAWKLYEQVLALDAQGPSSPKIALTYYNMGMVRADQERWDEALALYDSSLQLCQQTRYLIHEPAIHLNRAEALLGKGELAGAREACGRALRGFRRQDDGLGVADALRLYGRLCRLEGQWEDSRGYLKKSIELNRQFGEPISLGETFYELGLLEQQAGCGDKALELLGEAERLFVRAGAALDLDRVRTALEEVQPA
jgi:tetratricopeptide (TPR) repeat protein